MPLIHQEGVSPVFSPPTPLPPTLRNQICITWILPPFPSTPVKTESPGRGKIPPLISQQILPVHRLIISQSSPLWGKSLTPSLQPQQPPSQEHLPKRQTPTPPT